MKTKKELTATQVLFRIPLFIFLMPITVTARAMLNCVQFIDQHLDHAQTEIFSIRRVGPSCYPTDCEVCGERVRNCWQFCINYVNYSPTWLGKFLKVLYLCERRGQLINVCSECAHRPISLISSENRWARVLGQYVKDEGRSFKDDRFWCEKLLSWRLREEFDESVRYWMVQ